MQNTQNLIASIYVIKQAGSGRLAGLLKTLALAGTSGLVGGVLGAESGTRRGYRKGYADGGMSSNQDLIKGLSKIIQEVSAKGKEQ